MMTEDRRQEAARARSRSTGDPRRMAQQQIAVLTVGVGALLALLLV